ncbi:butyrophilin 2 isoform X1 [Labeo rohita]|uniref:Butyrophilin 2 isoform X1 n=1 Tax=Labeo rohita TaxID=84645 RepID=A0A498NNE5_LABRO|nr:butyrophilin 2 isoform X1 [Labeo rohita]
MRIKALVWVGSPSKLSVSYYETLLTTDPSSTYNVSNSPKPLFSNLIMFPSGSRSGPALTRLKSIEGIPPYTEDFSLVVPPAPVFANPGSDIILPAHLSPETSAVSMEIKWSRGAELIYQYNNGQENTNTEYESRVSLSIRELENGKLALTLRNVQQTDSGDYTCKVFHDGCQQTGLIHLQVRAEDFSLVVPPAPVFANPGSDIILPAHLSPETSAMSMEIKWSRGAELIYQYNNGQENTNTEYESRVSLSIRELENGKLALTLRNVQQTDSGDYTCKVFHDGCQQTGLIHLQVRGFVPKRRSSMDEDRPLIVVEPEGSDFQQIISQRSRNIKMAENKEVSETKQKLSLVCPSNAKYYNLGDDAILLCHLKPAISAASMEIKWWKKADLVCCYKDQQMTVSKDYEGRVSFPLEDLHNGNVSLTLRDIRRSQKGIYICEIVHECQTIQGYISLNISSEDFSLVVPPAPVSAYPESDVILPAHLSPETCAVSMEIRWSRGAELIYQYNNGQEKTNKKKESRVSLSIQELEKGKLALILRNVQQTDSGVYTCKVVHSGFQKKGVVHLQVRDLLNDIEDYLGDKFTDPIIIPPQTRDPDPLEDLLGGLLYTSHDYQKDSDEYDETLGTFEQE